MTDSTVAATSGSSKFYALVTNTNPSQKNTPQYQVVTLLTWHVVIIASSTSPTLPHISLFTTKMVTQLQKGGSSR
jgi:hypothetical protein